MASFGTQKISYRETRAVDPYEWDVRYGLKFDGDAVTTSLKVKLTGADPGANRQVWEDGVNDIWNHRAFFSDGTRLYEVKLDFDFVTSGQHQTVNVGAGSGRFNMTQWYQTPQGWDAGHYDEVAAHEIGHMLGNFDQYPGGGNYADGTPGGYVTTGTLMSDLTQGGFQSYFWTIEYYTEFYGHFTNLTTVLAQRGTGSANTLTGNSGMDGIYGFGGADSIKGLDGNDWLDGGSGNDTLNGGKGNDRLFGTSGADKLYGKEGKDILNGGGSADKFMFDTKLAASNVDTIVGFVSGSDKICLDDTIFGAIGAELSRGEFYAHADAVAAHDGNDFLIYNTTNGRLYYDADGDKTAFSAIQFATLSGKPDCLFSDYSIV